MMELSFDEIAYGNPTLEKITLMAKESQFDYLYDSLCKILPPLNSSEITQKELNDLVSYTGYIVSNKELVDKYLSYDKSLSDYIIGSLKSVGIHDEKIASTIQSLYTDTMPIINRLKFYFDRPRPNQLAHYYKLQVFPLETQIIDTPSYPSSNAFFAKLICEVLGNLYPKYYDALKSLADDIAMSRLYLGVNYASDIDMGMYCADILISEKSFKLKYKI